MTTIVYEGENLPPFTFEQLLLLAMTIPWKGEEGPQNRVVKDLNAQRILKKHAKS